MSIRDFYLSLVEPDYFEGVETIKSLVTKAVRNKQNWADIGYVSNHNPRVIADFRAVGFFIYVGERKDVSIGRDDDVLYIRW